MTSASTAERSKGGNNQKLGAEVELLPKSQSDAIMQKMMTKMVEKPSLRAQEKEKEMNKKIEKVFELDSF